MYDSDYGKKVTLDNLTELQRRMISLGEIRLAHISELAIIIYTMASGESDGYARLDDLRSCYRSMVGRKLPLDDIPEANRPGIELLCHSLSCCDRVALCRAIMAMSEYPYTLDDFIGREPMKSSNRVAYLHSVYADSAYRVFSDVLSSPTVKYSDSFTAVCEDVYYGRAGLCILPVETSGEGMLASFANLINRYEFHTVLECVIPNNSGGSTRFALLGKNVEHLTLPEKIRRTNHLELSMRIRDDGISVSDMLLAAEGYGLTLERTSSLPITDEEGVLTGEGYACFLRFLTDGADLEGFLYFLGLEAPGAEVKGIFAAI